MYFVTFALQLVKQRVSAPSRSRLVQRKGLQMLLRPKTRRPARDQLVPDADSLFALRARNFATTIARDPQRFNLTAEDAAWITQRVKEYRNALAKATRPSTRTRPAVKEKNTARAEAERVVRAFRKVIAADDRISAGDKIILHIKERSTKPKRRKCPKNPPVLIFEGSTTSGLHKLRYCEDLGTGSKQKPVGAERVEIAVEFVRVGEKTPKFPESLTGRPWILRSFSSSPFEVDCPDPGSVGITEAVQAVYWGRWADAVGEVSAWSRSCKGMMVAPQVVAHFHKTDEGDETLRKAA